jgi:Protein of unknown function (DUF4239)
MVLITHTEEKHVRIGCITFRSFGWRWWFAVPHHGRNLCSRHGPRDGERARAFKAVSPGILSPLGVIFGLFVAFTAVQVWNDNDRANAAVGREASALREVVVLAASFPGEPQARLRALIRRHIEVAATQEWPMMAHRTAATMNITPRRLDEALQLTLALTPSGQGQQIAQREIATELEPHSMHAISASSSA